MFNAPLYDKVIETARLPISRFFVPGHKGHAGQIFSEISKYDLTEIPGLPYLFEDAGVIKEAEGLMAAAFGAKECFFSANGSTGAIHGALCHLRKTQGEKILVSRECHKAVISSLILYDFDPEFLAPDILRPFSICAPVLPQEVEEGLKRSGAKTVVVTSPTYYGAVSDTRKIREVCDKYGAKLFVDGAHSAHFAFGEGMPPVPARFAHYCSVSIHKTLPALTGGACLFVNDLSLRQEIKSAMSLTSSSSPSFLILASMDYARAAMEEKGQGAHEEVLKLASDLRVFLSKFPLALLNGDGFLIDPLRLTVKSRYHTGGELYNLLKGFGIVSEMYDESNVVFVFTAADEKEDFERLKNAFESIFCDMREGGESRLEIEDYNAGGIIPRHAVSLKEAYFSESAAASAEEAAGEICAEMIYRYPPGIPFLLPGEIISGEMLPYFKKLNINQIKIIKRER